MINALIPLNCDEGEINDHRRRGDAVANILRISLRKVDRAKKRFVKDLNSKVMLHPAMRVGVFGALRLIKLEPNIRDQN